MDFSLYLKKKVKIKSKPEIFPSNGKMFNTYFLNIASTSNLQVCLFAFVYKLSKNLTGEYPIYTFKYSMSNFPLNLFRKKLKI